MNKTDLLEWMETWENLEWMVHECSRNPELLSLLMEIALNHPNPKTWRAAYLADKIHDNFPELIVPYLNKMVEKLKSETNLSKKRHFLKLLSMNEISPDHFGFLFNFCIETLASDEPPAVRVHAMQIMYNISEKEPELKPEILALILHEMEHHSTAGIISRGTKLVKKLQRQIRQTSS